jgi:hypothetical protein
MLAIVLESDPHSRDAITTMLQHLGYSRVLHAEHVDEAIYFFSREKYKVNLIVSSAQANYSEDLPISRFLLKASEMNLCPLLVSVDEWIKPMPSPFQSRFSRVDSVITKPFYENRFHRAIIRAHERRATLRNTLLIYGGEAIPDLEESVFSASRACHWKLVIRLKTKEELIQVCTQTEFRVGGLILPAECATPDIVKELRQFKRTVMGAATPLGIVGDYEADMPHDLRLLGDVFFEKKLNPVQIAVRLSKRLIHHWEVQNTSFKKASTFG